jgi:hypothetical protein
MPRATRLALPGPRYWVSALAFGASFGRGWRGGGGGVVTLRPGSFRVSRSTAGSPSTLKAVGRTLGKIELN